MQFGFYFVIVLGYSKRARNGALTIAYLMELGQAWSFPISPVLSSWRSLYLLFLKVEWRLAQSSDGEAQLKKIKHGGYFEFSAALILS